MLILGEQLDPPDGIEFVGGPRHGESEPGTGEAPVIPMPGGSYRRSVRCADDRVLRYVWEALPETAPSHH